MTNTSPHPAHENLTVVLCTYNGARFIAEQLRSIMTQTLLPAVVVVADDSSSDDTLDRVLAVWRGQDDRFVPRLEILPARPDRLGPARNFDRALGAVRTEFVALSDQDDLWEPDRLQIGVTRLEAADAPLLVASNTMLVDEQGHDLGDDSFSRFGLSVKERAQVLAGDPLPTLVRRNFLQGMTFTCRTDLARLAGPTPHPFMHDYWLALTAASLERMVVIDEPLVRYRLHGANVVGTGDRRVLHRLAKRAHWAVTHDRCGVPRRLTEWNAVATGLLGRDDLPEEQQQLLSRKLVFERARFRGARHRIVQWRTVAGLVRSGDYGRFDRDGTRGAVDDLLWRRGGSDSERSRTSSAPAREANAP